MADPFEKANPNISIELSSDVLTFENGSLQTTLQSGEGPDVLSVNSGPGRVGLLASSGLILPLDDLYASTGIADVYLPDVMQQIRDQNADGKIYEIVEGLDVFQFYYRKDIFEKQGLVPPKSWDDFLTLCQSLQDSGTQPILLGARDNFQGGWLLGNLVQASAGREAMTEVIYGKGDFTQPNIVRAADLLKQLVDKEYIKGLEAAALSGDQAQAAFGQAQGAMIVLAQGQVLSLGRDGIDLGSIGSFLLPSLNTGQAPAPTSGLATSWVISAATKQRDAAEAWMKWAASDDFLRIEIENGGFLVPARKVPDGVVLPPTLQDAVDKLAKGAGYNPSVYFSAPAKDAWYAAVQTIITGQSSPEKAFANVQAGLEKGRAAKK
ncbi:MAG: ABC transporter substrate-binding protein [Thermomicrobiales bacterium]